MVCNLFVMTQRYYFPPLSSPYHSPFTADWSLVARSNQGNFLRSTSSPIGCLRIPSVYYVSQFSPLFLSYTCVDSIPSVPLFFPILLLYTVIYSFNTAYVNYSHCPSQYQCRYSTFADQSAERILTWSEILVRLPGQRRTVRREARRWLLIPLSI